MAVTKLADLVIPVQYLPYIQQETEVKSRLVQSGVLVPDAALDQALAGGGKTFESPSFRDLPDDADNTSTDDDGTNATPSKITTSEEVQVRLSRNAVWSSMDLSADIAGADPLQSVISRASFYRARRLQDAFIATVKGVFADNAAAPSGTEHVQNDMTVDLSNLAGGSFSDGITNFSAEAVIDAKLTMGDSMQDLGLICVHSVIYGRMQKNNLIDMIPDSEGVYNIPTFNGMIVIVDDSMPVTAGVYNTWLFGRGALRLGQGNARVPMETYRLPLAGNGGGQESLIHRWEWIIHPVGCKYAGTAPTGGPTNAATSNNLAAAGSWQRVFPERKQIKIARLITREA